MFIFLDRNEDLWTSVSDVSQENLIQIISQIKSSWFTRHKTFLKTPLILKGYSYNL